MPESQLDLLSWQPEPALMQEPSLPLPPNRHVLGWHYAGLHYYRRMILRFMTLPSPETAAKQVARRHMINHLHRLSEACSTKIKQLGGI